MLQKLREQFLVNESKVSVVRSRSDILLRRLLFILFYLISVLASLYLGEYWSDTAATERDILQKENADLSAQLEIEKVKSAGALVQMETAQIAVELVRQNNIALSTQISELERDLTHYRRVMSPIKNDKGLRIDTLALSPSSDAGRFYLNMVLTQLGRKNRSVILGTINVAIIGSESGLKKEYSLLALKLTDNDLAIKFRFKYFQELGEEFVLPEGFTPEQIRVSAQSTGKKAMFIEQTENWVDLLSH